MNSLYEEEAGAAEWCLSGGGDDAPAAPALFALATGKPTVLAKARLPLRVAHHLLRVV